MSAKAPVGGSQAAASRFVPAIPRPYNQSNLKPLPHKRQSLRADATDNGGVEDLTAAPVTSELDNCKSETAATGVKVDDENDAKNDAPGKHSNELMNSRPQANFTMSTGSKDALEQNGITRDQDQSAVSAVSAHPPSTRNSLSISTGTCPSQPYSNKPTIESNSSENTTSLRSGGHPLDFRPAAAPFVPSSVHNQHSAPQTNTPSASNPAHYGSRDNIENQPQFMYYPNGHAISSREDAPPNPNKQYIGYGYQPGSNANMTQNTSQTHVTRRTAGESPYGRSKQTYDTARASHNALHEPSNTMRPPHHKVLAHAENISIPSNFPPSYSDSQIFPAVATFIHDQFASPEFADCTLLFSHTSHKFAPFILPAHSIIIARSPKMRGLMKHSARAHDPQTSTKQLPLLIDDNFLSDQFALLKALRRLYTGELPDLHSVLRIHSATGIDHMRYALSYAAAGHLLQIEEIVCRGLDIACAFLSLEAIEIALAFALDGGLLPSWYQRASSSEENESTTSSADDSLFSPDALSAMPTYGIYSDQLLHNILGFTMQVFTPQFTFQPRTAQFGLCPRLPGDAEQRHSRSNSRLVQIQFGEMNMSEEMPDNHVSRIISSLLISLPFPALKHLLEHDVLLNKLGPSHITQIMQQVISERERRRKAALHNIGSVEPRFDMDERLRRNLQWAEGVETSQQHPSGLRLSRHRIGTETPVSGKS